MYISDSVRYVGVNDHDIDLFEGQYVVPNGMSYNSYVILDEKIAVLDTVDAAFFDQWLDNVRAALDDRAPDYLVVHHMEPDHSANILNFVKAYPDVTVVSSVKAFQMMKNFFGTDFAEKRIIVKEGDTLSLGAHTLTFVAAPMVHWPEVVMSYESKEKILFSADGFGKFGALDVEEEWDCEARRYYIGIVGKYGAQVQAVLKKAAGLDIQTICPLHGPVLKEDLGHYLSLYNTWSSYEPEEEGVTVAYTSVYGNTRKAVLELVKKLEDAGVTVALHDLARDDMAEAVEDAFRYSKLVLATTTYNAEIFPYMHTFIHHLTERNFQKRTVAFVENGSWAPVAAKVMKKMLESSKELNFAEHTVTIQSALNDESSAQLERLARELSQSAVSNNEKGVFAMKKYVCGVCGWVYDEAEGYPEGGIAPGTKWEDLPEDFECPLCSVGKDQFEEE